MIRTICFKVFIFLWMSKSFSNYHLTGMNVDARHGRLYQMNWLMIKVDICYLDASLFSPATLKNMKHAIKVDEANSVSFLNWTHVFGS